MNVNIIKKHIYFTCLPEELLVEATEDLSRGNQDTQ